MKKISVRAPASVANLVCGFDVLGLCLEKPYDEMELTLLHERKVVLENLNDATLSVDPQLNTAGAALLALLNEVEEAYGFAVRITKNIKPGSGLGSSAASAAGAVAGANFLLQERFNKHQLVQFAMQGEKVASGVAHADNVAPLIYGGVTLIRQQQPLDVVPLNAPPLYIAIVHPQIEVRTSDARNILRKEILLADAIKQWGNIAGLVAGLLQGDYRLIGRSLDDGLIEPLRSVLIPQFNTLKQKCLEAGALGGGISGSGPSVFMLCQSEDIAKKVEQIMQQTYDAIELPYYTYVTTINKQGCTIHP